MVLAIVPECSLGELSDWSQPARFVSPGDEETTARTTFDALYLDTWPAFRPYFLHSSGDSVFQLCSSKCCGGFRLGCFTLDTTLSA